MEFRRLAFESFAGTAPGTVWRVVRQREWNGEQIPTTTWFDSEEAANKEIERLGSTGEFHSVAKFVREFESAS